MTNDIKNVEAEVSLKEVLISINKWVIYFLSKWKLLSLLLIIGALFGLCYSILTPLQYQAKSTFIVDDHNQSNTDIGVLGVLGLGGSENPGLFSGDNLIWLYSSKNMLEQTLLSKGDTSLKDSLLIDRFINIDNDIKKLAREIHSDYITKNSTLQNLNRKQKTVLKAAVNNITKNYLVVKNEDKSTSIISVIFTSKDENFSRDFVNNLVRNVNSFYINTKTKKTSDQIEILEKKVVEYNNDINRNMYQAASAIQAIPNPNPNLQTIKVEPQRKSVDIQINSTLYSQIVAQLEAAKISLAKETPIIEIIDKPDFPLTIIQHSKFKCSVIGGIVALIVTLIILFLKKLYNDTVNS